LEQERTIIARHWLHKYVSAAKNKYATTAELMEVVFSVWFVLMQYMKNQWQVLDKYATIEELLGHC
jgi:hypothetical protein